MKYLKYMLLSLLILASGCARTTLEKAARAEDMQVSDYVQENSKLKWKVLVTGFSYGPFLDAYTESPDVGMQDPALLRIATDQLVRELEQSGRIVPVDRSASLKVSESPVTVDEFQQHTLPDLQIRGHIKEIIRTSTVSDSATAVTRTTARIGIDVLNTHSGEVIHRLQASATSTNEQKTVADSLKETSDPAIEMAVSQAIKAFQNDLLEVLVEQAWTARIFSVSGGTAFIQGGKLMGIGPGDEFQVYQLVQPVSDSLGTSPIRPSTQLIAKLKVVELIPGSELSELAVAHISEGRVPPEDLNSTYISDK